MFCLTLDLTSVERSGFLNLTNDHQCIGQKIPNVMPDNYEDNFGFYSVGDDPDEGDFLHYIKLTSVRKVCVRCNQIVYLQSQKEMCATCAEAIAYGAPPSLEEY
jgi:hypothetical protein